MIPAGSRQVMQSMQSLMIYFFPGWNRRAETHGSLLDPTYTRPYHRGIKAWFIFYFIVDYSVDLDRIIDVTS